MLRFVPVILCAAATGMLGCSKNSPTSPTSNKLTAPSLTSPTDGAAIESFRPTLTIANATAAAGARSYEFQIADSSAFTTIVARAAIPEGSGGATSFTPDFDLQTTTRFYWRVRTSQDSNVSSWSTVRNFTTPIMGYNRPGELYDPLTSGSTVGEVVGATAFVTGRGIRLNDGNSYVRYQLQQPLSAGEFSMEVEGLYPNGPGEKLKVFSMSDSTYDVYRSSYLLVAQYRGVGGNPDNCITFKALLGDPFYKLEPDFGQRAGGVMGLDPGQAYIWKGTWGNFFRLTVQSSDGTTLYDLGIPVSSLGVSATAATYNPTPHFAYLGANNGPFGEESGSWPGAVYRNVWISTRPRPASLGSALRPPR